MKQNHKYEKLFWSIALPGFGQILNGKFLKGMLFIGLEFLINVQSNFNKVILLSFHGDIKTAIQQTNYGWLMFYPCLYFFAMWDAYKDAGGGGKPFSFMPFAFSAYSVTIGLIYSPDLRIMGILLGPIWLPILSLIPGVVTGLLLKKIIKLKSRQSNS
ncbi:hypothetical protein MUO14_12800 [Halobacillus shinanisalinarum]|uniref:Uncharacterized protein n=1 Tax=Halobacillus shinanisalinarum TaxID=2932258 RepID=A0ABY4GTW3_9BACI|nr:MULTISPECIES: hypothetical protein [Halobacillus]UOQ91464.1 hypothetical protein MUO14_12800 [Halobacillus shinanisalinarum]